ncbi:MAG: type IV pili methyl-accepting chemotaxis transducer N-terminal domain-containing protein [Sulfurovaceae bacterium]|nr:type IV pili methyl-accepting chemotaxis transducer N-terminal domain-containing protein [Sulfurovaceae bacterium]
MKKTGQLLTLLLIFPISIFAFTDKELAISIDLSGKQRMLTQKMTKESFLINLSVEKEKNIEKLKSSSTLFDKTLKGLMQGDKSLELIDFKDNEITAQLKKVETLWIPFYKEIKSVIENKTTKKSYEHLENSNIALLKEMNKAVTLYSQKKSSNFKLGHDMNLAGKQRMLTQKMAKDLVIINSGIKVQNYKDDFKLARGLFTKTLNGLSTGDQGLKLQGAELPQIKKKLKVVETLWQNEQSNLDKALSGKKIQQTVQALDTILVEMNSVVSLYTNSLNRSSQKDAFAALLSGFMEKDGNSKKRINLSGKQRMLTQRMSKLAVMLSLNLKVKDSSTKILEAAKLYDKTLGGFKHGDADLGCIPVKNKAVVAQIPVVDKLWQEFYANVKLVAKGDKGKALAFIIENNEKLLFESNKLVSVFEKSNKNVNYLEKSMLNLINVAGRQRMLTQKMTKEKLLLVRLPNKGYEAKLQKTVKLFDESLIALIDGDSSKNITKPTTTAIKGQLQKVADIWKKLKPLYAEPKSGAKSLGFIILNNTKLLKEMNKMVGMAADATEY